MEKKNLLRKIVPLLVLLILLSTNYILMVTNIISYALEEVSPIQTNHKNVDFDVYFAEKAKELEDSDDKTQTLYLEVEVKNEGYFTGTINLKEIKYIKKDWVFFQSFLCAKLAI